MGMGDISVLFPCCDRIRVLMPLKLGTIGRGVLFLFWLKRELHPCHEQ